jgi:hypothetical protein
MQKQFMLGVAKVIARKIYGEKVKRNGRVPYGLTSKLLNKGKETYPQMSRKTIYNYISVKIKFSNQLFR